MLLLIMLLMPLDSHVAAGLPCNRRIRSTPEAGGDFYERAFARLEGSGPSKQKEDAEVALLHAQAQLCVEKLITEKAATKGAEIANRAAQIANLKSIMETGELGDEEMAQCRKKLYILAMELS
jgi:hypothetical protein